MPLNMNHLSFVFIIREAAGSETTMTSSSGQTFQITGTSVGGKVVTTKLSVPANSKIVTVNVPTSQGGMGALSIFIFYYFLWASLRLVYTCLSALFSTAHIPNFVTKQRGTRVPTQTRVAMIVILGDLNLFIIHLKLTRHMVV